MHLLILGGTGFIGPHQVAYALRRGHHVTLFNRGRQKQSWSGPVETLIGDRDGDLQALAGREWDVCIDNSTTLPSRVRSAAHVLKGHVGHYVFISTFSAYAAHDRSADETAPLAGYEGIDPMAETITSLSADRRLYGSLKVLSESEAQTRYGEDNTAIIRAGLIVGPGDETDRFTYWPARLSRGGRILAPGNGSDPVQFIDVRDLAEWTIRMAERRTAGVFNATGPDQALTMGGMLTEIGEGIGIAPQLVWAPTAFLKENQVSPWSDMPVWLPGEGETFGFHRRDIRRAVAAGLTHRPLPLTATDTLDWLRTLPPERQVRVRAGLAPEREVDLLAKLAA